MADDTTDMTTNDVDGAGTASEVVDVPVAGVNAGLFDRPKSEDELAGTAAGGAVAAKATVLSQKPKKSSNSAPPVNRKLLWLLAAVAVGGLAFVVLSGGDDDASPAAGSDTPSDETVVDGGTAAGIDPAELASPKMSIQFGANSITISGLASSEDAKSRITKSAQTALGDTIKVTNSMVVNTSAAKIDDTKDPLLKMLADPVMKGVSANGIVLGYGKSPIVIVVAGQVSTELAKERVIGAAAGAAGGIDKVEDKATIDTAKSTGPAKAPAAVQERIDKLLTGRVIEFASGSTSLTSEWQKTVDDVAAALKGSDASVQIVGHTDDVGDIDINQTLSEERASAIKSALVAQGIEASRITTAGFGPTKPVASNGTADGRQRNRRIEFVVAAG